MKTITTQAKTATVKELRWFLAFSMSICTVINGDEEISYKESREYLTSLEQNRVYNYVIEDGYLYIWG